MKAALVAWFLKVFNSLLVYVTGEKMQAAGEAIAEARTNKQTKEEIIERISIDNDVRDLTDDELDERLRRWQRPNSN